MTTPVREPRTVLGFDSAVARYLELHEARSHALELREVRDLGDAVLVHDRDDPEPFWNRLSAIRWPEDPRAFDARLDQALVLFATLGRRPHVWTPGAFGRPTDLIARLTRNGFVDVGGGFFMVLVDRSPTRPAVPPGFTMERIAGPSGLARHRLSSDIALVLAEAFGAHPTRRPALAAELAAALRSPALSLYLIRAGREPVAVAKLTTLDDATYLSSIGVRGPWRGRGLGRLVTQAAIQDATDAGSRWIYLGIEDGNVAARRLYESLGFVVVGDRSADLLLR
jgi:GNAT superfamily N-acetyltransferase